MHHEIAHAMGLYKQALRDSELVPHKGWNRMGRGYIGLYDDEVNNVWVKDSSLTNISKDSLLRLESCNLRHMNIVNSSHPDDTKGDNLILRNCNMMNCEIHATGLIENQRLARATINGRVLLTSRYSVFTVGPSPTSHRTVTAHHDLDIGIRVNTGCFSGTLEQYRERLEDTHKFSALNLAYHRNAHALIQSWVDYRRINDNAVDPQPGIQL